MNDMDTAIRFLLSNYGITYVPHSDIHDRPERGLQTIGEEDKNMKSYSLDIVIHMYLYI